MVRKSDYPATLWEYETGRRLKSKLGIPLDRLLEMPAEYVELLDHIAKCEDMAAENARIVTEAQTPQK